MKMPNKRNNIFKGKPKVDFRGYFNEDGHEYELEDGGLTTNDRKSLGEGLSFLLDMFRNIDKEIVQAVFLEYNGNLKESIESLMEISGERSSQQMEGKSDNIDLAIIACSLLVDESQPTGTSSLDIYDNPEGSSTDLGSAALPDTIFNSQVNSSTKVGNVGSATNLHESLLAAGSKKCSSSVDSSRNGRNNMSPKHYVETRNGNNIHCFDKFIYPDLHNVESFDIFISENDKVLKQKTNSLNGLTCSSNLMRRTGNSKEKVVFPHDSPFTSSCNISESSNTWNVRICSDNNENASFGNVINQKKMSFSGVEMQGNVCNNGFDIPDKNKQSDAKFPVNGSVNYLNGSNVNSLSTTSEWDKFYSKFEPDLFNAYYESIIGVDKIDQSASEMSSATLKASYPPDNSAVSSGNKPSNMKNRKKILTEKSHANAASFVVNNYNMKRCGSSAAGDKATGIYVNALHKSSSSDSQFNSIHLSVSNRGNCVENNMSAKVSLSPGALEFIPRPLVIHQPKQIAQEKVTPVITEFINHKANIPESLYPSQVKSPENNKGKKTNGKDKNQAELIDLIPHNGLPQQSVDSFNHNPLFKDTRHNSKTGARSEVSKQIDPVDPLGWNDILSRVTLFVDPLPQREKKARKASGNKSAQKPAPPTPFPPWQNKPSEKLREVKINESKVSSSMMKPQGLPAERFTSSTTTNDTRAISSVHERSETENLPKSESSLKNKHTSRTQGSPILTRLPPSLLGRVALATAATDVNNSESVDMDTTQTPNLSPKKKIVHITVETRPQSAVTFSVQPQLIKNKLQLRGLKTPVGIIRRYVLEKKPVVIILRGLPGSGKTYLAKQLIGECQEMGVHGVKLSTDDFFMKCGQYSFNKNNLSDAHDWNKKRALQCLKESISPIIIDNTNTTMWELLPYAVLALEHSYDVQILEPDTPWKMKVMELARKNSHNVQQDQIKKMKERWEIFTLDDVLKQASQSIASRKTPTIVPVTFAQLPNAPTVQQQRPINMPITAQQQQPKDKQITDSKKVQVTEMNFQKSNSETSNSPSVQDLGLSDWSEAQAQRSLKKNKKKRQSIATPSDKSPKHEITQEFLNISLKEVMVNLMSMSQPQTADSLNENNLSQDVNLLKNGSSNNHLNCKVTITERQVSDGSCNSDTETPKADKDIQSFQKFAEPSSDTDLKHAKEMDDVTCASLDLLPNDLDRKKVEATTVLPVTTLNSVGMQEQDAASGLKDVSHNLVGAQKEEIKRVLPDVSLNLLEILRQGEEKDSSSGLNDSWNTCSSYNTLRSGSDVSSYHTVDGDDFLKDLPPDMLTVDNIEDINQDLHTFLQQDIESEVKIVVDNEEDGLFCEEKTLYSEKCEVENVSNVTENLQASIKDSSRCEYDTQKLSPSSGSNSMVDTTVLATLMNSDNKNSSLSFVDSHKMKNAIEITCSEKKTDILTSHLQMQENTNIELSGSKKNNYIESSDGKKNTDIESSDGKKNTDILTSFMDSNNESNTTMMTPAMVTVRKVNTDMESSFISSESKKNTDVTKSLQDFDDHTNSPIRSMNLDVADNNIQPYISGLSSLVAYSDSGESDRELPLFQNNNHVAGQKFLEHHANKDFAKEDDSVLPERINSRENVLLTTENLSRQGQVGDRVMIHSYKVSDRAYVREISVDRSTQSSEDSMTSGREQSPQIGSQEVPDGQQLKKKKKRIRKGRNPGPFIEDSLKMKSKMQNWSSFVVPSSGSSNGSGDSSILESEGPKIEISSSATQTDPYYFSFIHKLNSPAFNNLQPVDLTFSGVQVMSSHLSTQERWMSQAAEADTTTTRKLGSTVDKSTITDETLEKEEVDLETLKSCFPEYSRRQLETTMTICQNNLEWVTSHLLDSPALYDMEDDEEEVNIKADMLAFEKKSMTSEMSKNMVKSLADICTELVRKANKVDADDLEMQVIQVGEGRLQKIEMFGRSRLHSLSQENFGNQDYWPDDFVLDEFSVPLPTYDSHKRLHNFGQQSQPILYETSPFESDSGFMSPSAKEQQFHSLPPVQDTQMPIYISMTKNNNISSERLTKLHEAVNVTEVTRPVGQPATVQSHPVMPVDFVRQLESLYGSLHMQIDDGGLALDDSTARKIYNCLKLQATKNPLKNSNEQQLKNDEALARALQDEENSKTLSASDHNTAPLAHRHVSNRQSTVPGWTNQNPPWMSQGRDKVERNQIGSINTSGESKTFRPHSVADTLHRLRGTQRKKVKGNKFQHKLPGTVKSVWYKTQGRGQVDSLHSIMEEELAREKQQREQLRFIASTGDMEALATRIKRIELSHLFPSMGPDVLEDIFRSSGYSKEETIRVLEQSYGILPVPMPKDKEDILNQLRNSQENFEHNVEYDDEFSNEDSESTYDVLRNEAQLCRQLFVECQQQALRYQTDGMQGAALFYRQRAKKYKEDERNANSKAAQVLFEKGSERLRLENTLDLHFYHLDEAINAVNTAIEMKEDEYKKRQDKKSSYLDIVTGWGRNSKNGKPKLKPAIIHHLWAKCFQYEERSPGMLRVYIGKKLQ